MAKTQSILPANISPYSIISDNSLLTTKQFPPNFQYSPQSISSNSNKILNSQNSYSATSATVQPSMSAATIINDSPSQPVSAVRLLSPEAFNTSKYSSSPTQADLYSESSIIEPQLVRTPTKSSHSANISTTQNTNNYVTSSSTTQLYESKLSHGKNVSSTSTLLAFDSIQFHETTISNPVQTQTISTSTTKLPNTTVRRTGSSESETKTKVDATVSHAPAEETLTTHTNILKPRSSSEMTDPSRSQSTIPMRRPVSAFRQSEEYHARRLSALSTLSAASTFDDDDAQSYLDAESIIEEEQQRETENGYHRLLTMPDRIARRKQKQSRKELERSMKYAGTSEPVSVPKRKPSTLMKSFLGEVVDNFSASWNNGKSKSKYVGSSLKKSVDTWDNTASNFTTTTTTTTTTMSTKSEWESNGQNHLLRSTSSHQRSWSESDSENPIFGILSTASKVIFGVDLQNEEKQQPVVIAKPLVTSSSPCRSGSRKSITKITRRRSERITSKLLSPVLSEDNRRASSDGVYSRTSLSNVDESDAASTKSSSGTSVSSVSSMKITPELFTKSHLRPVRSTKPRPPSWFTGDSSFTVGEEETGPLHSSRPPKKKKGWSYGVNYDENSGDTTDDDDASSASSVGDEFKTAHAEYNDEGDVNFGDIGFKDDARLAELVSSRSASTGLEFFPPISRFETRSPSPRLFTSQRTNEGGNQEIVQYKIDTRRYSVSEANTPAATTPNDTSLMSPKAMMGAYFDGVYSSGGSTPQKTPAATFPRAEPLKRDPQGRRNSHQSKRLSITSMSAILPSQTSITSLTSLVSMVDISDTSTIKNFIPPNFYTNGVYIVVGDPYDADGTFLSKFTLYTLTVKLLRPNLPGYNNATACNFTVQRRYSDFRQFYLNLIRKYTEITNWPLLPRKSFFERFNATTIHERIKSFTEIMNFIALHPTLHNCQDVLEFLGVIPPSTVPTNTSNVPLQSSPLKNSSLLTHTSELNSNNKRPVFTRMSGDNGRFSGDCSRNSSDGSEVLSRRNYENDGDGWPKSVSMWGVSSEIHESPTTASGGSIANGGALTTGTNNVEDDRGRARNRQIEQAQERARLRSFSNPL